MVLLRKIIDLVDDVEQGLSLGLFIGNLLSGGVGLLDEVLIIAGLDHHHGSTELFFRSLLEVADQW